MSVTYHYIQGAGLPEVPLAIPCPCRRRGGVCALVAHIWCILCCVSRLSAIRVVSVAAASSSVLCLRLVFQGAVCVDIHDCQRVEDGNLQPVLR
jgi:hypothetical protein